MNHSIDCCDLCGRIVSINSKKMMPVWHIKIEIVGWRDMGASSHYRQERAKHADIHKNVCDECHDSMKSIGVCAVEWAKARTGINAAEITVKEKDKV